VFRINRIAVVADRRAVVFVFERRLQAIVARRTKATDRTGQEQIVIAVMRWEMIGDGRRRDAPLFLAEGAEGLDAKLMFGACPPPLQRVPGPHRKGLRWGDVSLGHGPLFKPIQPPPNGCSTLALAPRTHAQGQRGRQLFARADGL
jgi:hypothetical protein